MRYELWGLHPANLIDTFESEAEALEEVRGLLSAGWSADDAFVRFVEGGPPGRPQLDGELFA